MEIDRWLLFFLIQILFQSCHFQEQEEDIPVTSGCYNDLIKSNPTLKNRFSDDMLQQHCKKSETWKKQSLDRLGKTSKPLLSPAQLEWASNIWNCKNLKCLCGMFDFCKNFLKQIESGMAGGLGGFNASNFKGQNFAGGLSKIGRKRRQSQDDVLNDLLRDKVGKANRKEIRVMSNGERNRYFRALNKLKFEKIDNLGKYDIMIVYHTPEYSPEAHFCAAFLPFHRELLKSLEMALRVVEPDVALPYWDTTLDEGLPNARDSVLWSDDFFGNGNGDVISGPFANWTTIPDARFKTPLSNRLKIVRNLGASPFGSLMKDKDIDTLMAKSSFRQFSYCVDPFTELIHGSTHMWVGGHMLELRISPNDPSFFVFHTFVDYIWEQWRQQKQTRQQRESDYVNNQDACNQFAYGTEQMKPFTIKVRDGLSNMYTDQLYAYEPRPVCSVQNPSCGSVYLFCDTRRYKCLSKIKVGGNCNGFDGSDICYQSQCIGGKCQGVAFIQPLPTLAPIKPTIKPKPPIVTPPPAPVTSTVSLTAPPARPPFFSFIPSTESLSPKTTTSSPGQKTFPEVVVLIVTSTASVKSSTEKPAKTINQISTSTNTVWTPITVLSLTGRDAQPYPQAKIVSHDADHGFQFFGRTADPGQVPYYSGAAFAQILNPFSVNEQVESTVDVFDADDKKCVSLCINEKFIYVPCQPKVTLFIDSQKSDNVPYTPNFELAKFLNWNGNKRNPDKFLYLCSPTKSSAQLLSLAGPNPTPILPTIQKVPEAPEAPATRAPEAITSSPISLTTSQSSLTFKGGDKSKSTANSDEVVVRIITVNDQKSQRGNGGCQNLHRCCPIWASVGECKRNTWMQYSCQKDCNVCNSGSSDVPFTECSDNHPNCESWAKTDQCNQNPDWMEENCRSSCRVCDRSSDELKKLCGGSPKKGGECKDFNEKCKDWSEKQECQRNPWWMKENCALSCNAC